VPLSQLGYDFNAGDSIVLHICNGPGCAALTGKSVLVSVCSTGARGHKHHWQLLSHPERTHSSPALPFAPQKEKYDKLDLS